jgi:hypothetical protein
MNIVQTEFDFNKVLEAFKPLQDLCDKFYNTTGLDATELKKRQIKAGSQNGKILEYFKEHPYQNFTPFEIQELLGFVCINSVRRAISDLTDMGLLTMTSEKRMGKFGMMNNTWRIR